MAVFRRNFTPIDADIENIKGETIKLVSNKIITPDVSDALERIALEHEERIVNGVLCPAKTGSQIIQEQMIFVFGKDVEFYKQFDTSVLFQVIKWVSEQVLHPDVKKK